MAGGQCEPWVSTRSLSTGDGTFTTVSLEECAPKVSLVAPHLAGGGLVGGKSTDDLFSSQGNIDRLTDIAHYHIISLSYMGQISRHQFLNVIIRAQPV